MSDKRGGFLEFAAGVLEAIGSAVSGDSAKTDEQARDYAEMRQFEAEADQFKEQSQEDEQAEHRNP